MPPFAVLRHAMCRTFPDWSGRGPIAQMRLQVHLESMRRCRRGYSGGKWRNALHSGSLCNSLVASLLELKGLYRVYRSNNIMLTIIRSYNLTMEQKKANYTYLDRRTNAEVRTVTSWCCSVSLGVAVDSSDVSPASTNIQAGYWRPPDAFWYEILLGVWGRKGKVKQRLVPTLN